MSDELIINLSQGNTNFINALQVAYPGADNRQIEMLGNTLLGQMGQALVEGEKLASVRLRPDGNFDLRIWNIDRQGGG